MRPVEIAELLAKKYAEAVIERNAPNNYVYNYALCFKRLSEVKLATQAQRKVLVELVSIMMQPQEEDALVNEVYGDGLEDFAIKLRGAMKGMDIGVTFEQQEEIYFLFDSKDFRMQDFCRLLHKCFMQEWQLIHSKTNCRI